jgi:hypothetical protein
MKQMHMESNKTQLPIQIKGAVWGRTLPCIGSTRYIQSIHADDMKQSYNHNDDSL